MLEILLNSIQIFQWLFFDFAPMVVAAIIGGVGQQLIELDAFRYIIGSISLIIATGACKPIAKAIRR